MFSLSNRIGKQGCILDFWRRRNHLGSAYTHCSSCVFEADRDTNATWNILSCSLKNIGVSYSKGSLVEIALPTDTIVSAQHVVKTRCPNPRSKQRQPKGVGSFTSQSITKRDSVDSLSRGIPMTSTKIAAKVTGLTRHTILTRGGT
jgi:hypothetical protein